jgi:hypothetical protein
MEKAPTQRPFEFHGKVSAIEGRESARYRPLDDPRVENQPLNATQPAIAKITLSVKICMALRS